LFEVSVYVFKGQRIYDSAGDLLAVALRDMEGASVRWSKEDFHETAGSFNCEDPVSRSELTAALWRLNKAAKGQNIKTDWVI